MRATAATDGGGGAPSIREVLPRLAPGTALREGIDRIRRGHTGALLVLGHDDAVAALCAGGFAFDVEFAPTRLRELSKMDGAVVLSADGSRILQANVHLVPDPLIPTSESGTRHRSAERTARQTGVPVISVSKSMDTCTLYVGDQRHVLPEPTELLARADQALTTIERHSGRRDRSRDELDRAEIGDYATVGDVVAYAQQLSRLDRLVAETAELMIEMGAEGRRTWLQLDELVAGSQGQLRGLVHDHLHLGPVDSPSDAIPTPADVDTALERFAALTEEDLLLPGVVARILGLPAEPEDEDAHVTARGYRLLARIPRLRAPQIDALVARFGEVDRLLEAEQAEFGEVESVGSLWARHVHSWLARLVRVAAG